MCIAGSGRRWHACRNGLLPLDWLPSEKFIRATGAHKIETVPFPEWIPLKEIRKGAKLSIEQATALLRDAGMARFK